MRRVVETLTLLLPFLERYPRWVGLVVAAWVLLTAAVVVVLVVVPRRPPTSDGGGAGAQSASAAASPGARIYQAGRDIIVNDAGEREKNTFAVRHHTGLVANFPGPLLYLYDSKFGKRLAPVGYAAVIEVVNVSDSRRGLHDYFIDAAIHGEWVRLPNLGPLNLDQFYFAPQGLHEANRWDFTETSFDRQIAGKALPAGESVRGWVFLEWPKAHRGPQQPSFTKLRFTLESTAGTRETVTVDTNEPRDAGASSLGGGSVRPIPGKVDLRGIPILPHVDLLEGFRTGN